MGPNALPPFDLTGLNRRRLLAELGGLGLVAASLAACSAGSETGSAKSGTPSSRPAVSAATLGGILQPNQGVRKGTYVQATADNVLWGRLPNRVTKPIAVVNSGDVVTVDTVSHEGILEDQGKDPRAYFADHGVAPDDVLTDAIAIAANTAHDGPGPHVVTGPIAIRGAEVGDVLKIDVLDLALRVPYGVVSNREGLGALPGEYPEQFRGVKAFAPYLNAGGNVSVFTKVADDGGLRGVLPGDVKVSFPLMPFVGLMGVARDTAATVDSVPPSDTGGNLDITDLGIGSTLYLPVRVPGAMFYAGDPHMAQGDGEVALTAMEGSLRPTFRLTVIKKGQSGAPKIAFDYPFAESSDFWYPIGLSDPDGGLLGPEVTTLDAAMKTAVHNAMSFLVDDKKMAGPVAYAYLSAATDFVVSQVVDRTTGIHARIRKSDFS